MQVCVRDKWRRTSLNLKVEKLEISENRVKEILGGVDPVSYTHLDVYKRQLQKYIKRRGTLIIFIK